MWVTKQTPKNWLALAVGLFLLIAMSGCTSWCDYVRNGFKVGPNYCPTCGPVADHWIDDRDPSVSSEPNDAAWWQTFNDPVLDCLVQTAYRQNLSLRIAGFRILEARPAGHRRGKLVPAIATAFGDYMRTRLSQNFPNAAPSLNVDEWTLGTNLAWELDFWGRFRRAIEAADANLDAAVYNYDDVLVLLLSEVAQQYTDLRTPSSGWSTHGKTSRTSARAFGLADVKFRNGATTRLT